MLFSEILKELRKKKKMTQEEAAKKLGIARTTYSGYERGTSEPDIEGLKKISNVFEVDIDLLIGSNKKESELTLPESTYEYVIKEAEEKYGVNLRDDPVVNATLRELILSIAKSKKENK